MSKNKSFSGVGLMIVIGVPVIIGIDLVLWVFAKNVYLEYAAAIFLFAGLFGISRLVDKLQ